VSVKRDVDDASPTRMPRLKVLPVPGELRRLVCGVEFVLDQPRERLAADSFQQNIGESAAWQDHLLHDIHATRRSRRRAHHAQEHVQEVGPLPVLALRVVQHG
jgi:hypothetical protein